MITLPYYLVANVLSRSVPGDLRAGTLKRGGLLIENWERNSAIICVRSLAGNINSARNRVLDLFCLRFDGFR